MGKYRGQRNTEELLYEKSNILVAFIVTKLDIATTIYNEFRETISTEIPNNHPELSDELKTSIRVEEAALWYRVVDELAHRYLGPERPLFMDYFIDSLVNRLALEGAPPKLIITLEDRGKEYENYWKWLPSDDEGLRGTLLWEAAKHIGKPFDGDQDPFFLTKHTRKFVDLLKQALIYELLTGRSDRT